VSDWSDDLYWLCPTVDDPFYRERRDSADRVDKRLREYSQLAGRGEGARDLLSTMVDHWNPDDPIVAKVRAWLAVKDGE
jgi:hypothetical protein